MRDEGSSTGQNTSRRGGGASGKVAEGLRNRDDREGKGEEFAIEGGEDAGPFSLDDVLETRIVAISLEG